MITFQQVENLKDDPRFTLSLTEAPSGAVEHWAQLQGLRLTVSDGTGPQSFHAMLREFFGVLLADHHILFVLMERFTEPKSRLRSYKRAFRPVAKAMGPAFLLEEEIALRNGQTAFAALIEADRNQIEDLLTLLRSPFLAYGVVNPAEQQDDAELLYYTVQSSRCYNDLLTLNLPAVAQRVVKAQTLLFTINQDGQDRHYLNFFGWPQAVKEIIHLLHPLNVGLPAK